MNGNVRKSNENDRSLSDRIILRTLRLKSVDSTCKCVFSLTVGPNKVDLFVDSVSSCIPFSVQESK